MLKNIDQRFWETVIDSIQEGLMLIGADGKILFVNRAFEGLLGYTSDELVGRGCDVLQCDRCFKARANGMDKYCTLFKEKKLRSSECIFRRKDGAPVHILKNAVVIRDEDGKVVGGVETLIDLSGVIERDNEIAVLRQQLHYDQGFQGIIGNSPVMRRVFDLVTSAAQSEASIIIYGESGTGKEMIAEAIHHNSPRREAPFIKVNCAALNENLLESELFGHVKGAFTGADSARVGRFEAAGGGSIFLDEIGDLPLGTQTKLLRVLQEKELERVGDHRPVSIDVRVIAATNKDLRRLMKEGLFREDLFYRLGVVPVTLPPLRERTADIPLLVDIFINRIGQKSARDIVGISREALSVLVNYSWPGNVRELLNAIEYAFVICPGGTIGTDHLPDSVKQERGGAPGKDGFAPLTGILATEKEQLIEALQMARGNRSKAAAILGVSRVTVWNRIKKYSIELDVRARK